MFLQRYHTLCLFSLPSVSGSQTLARRSAVDRTRVWSLWAETCLRRDFCWRIATGYFPGQTIQSAGGLLIRAPFLNWTASTLPEAWRTSFAKALLKSQPIARSARSWRVAQSRRPAAGAPGSVPSLSRPTRPFTISATLTASNAGNAAVWRAAYTACQSAASLPANPCSIARTTLRKLPCHICTGICMSGAFACSTFNC